MSILVYQVLYSVALLINEWSTCLPVAYQFARLPFSADIIIIVKKFLTQTTINQDTLKRVVKAGDGTILATSPPYTRFLQSGVDFAIVSSGMPRVDIWVQEFLRREIPCVSADYLVDYICKPGYSLDRHVQYNTLAWAEKSLKTLANRMEEIVEDWTPEEDHDDDGDDITCQVCGSRDRGDVMLICGDESGSSGCGIGTHVDCCDPPLEEIPEEDWYCSKCKNRDRKKSQKNSGKSIFSSK